MSLFTEEYQRAKKQKAAYQAAKRTGWVVPGSRKRDNEAITVSRSGAVDAAEGWEDALYLAYTLLYQSFAMRDIMESALEKAEDKMKCPRCLTTYRESWGVGCPWCLAKRKAQEQVEQELREAEAPKKK